ncbi:MAG: aminotransferase class V-fold PLP-dependent enzyme, partial [Patescibacteria group bacterium]|nr:aminotransferase class V-fold PLP-dependent enzyme [Patescibacteria group bacterium]
MKQIYLDNAASTPIDPKVLTTICEQEKNNFGNSSSLHSFGSAANQVLEKSRKIIANFLNADTNEIIFTASATESNNLVLKGVCEE